MNEILFIATALIIGMTCGLALRKSPLKEDHSRCQDLLEKAADYSATEMGEVLKRHKEELSNVSAQSFADLKNAETRFLAQKDELLKGAFPITDALRELITEAEGLSAEQSKIDSSGESKRHQVYSRMIKNHPDAAKGDIALAIEFAVRGV